MVCPPVRGDNPRTKASGLCPVQADKPWYYYFYHRYQCNSMKYFALEYAIFGKGGIIVFVHRFLTFTFRNIKNLCVSMYFYLNWMHSTVSSKHFRNIPIFL